MNIYENTLEEIAESGNTRMTVTKMKYEFSKNPVEAIYKTNQTIWGSASERACASVLVALSSVNAPRYSEAIRSSIEAALWHRNSKVSEEAALALIQLNDSRSLKALEDVSRVYPDSKAFVYAINHLLRPL